MDPDQDQLWNKVRMADELYERQKYDLAIDICRQVLAVDPSHYEAQRTLVWSLMGSGDTFEKIDFAQKEADRLIEIAPDQSESLYLKAHLLLTNGSPVSAYKHAMQALQLDPGSVHAHGILVEIFRQLGRWDLVLKKADEILALEPENTTVLSYRVLSLLFLGQRQQGLEESERALAVDPESAFSHAVRGWILLELGRITEAEKYFSEGLRLDVNEDWARMGLLEIEKKNFRLVDVLSKVFYSLNYWIEQFFNKLVWNRSLLFQVIIVSLFLRGHNFYLQCFTFFFLGIGAIGNLMPSLSNTLLLRINSRSKHLLNQDQLLQVWALGIFSALSVILILIHYMAGFPKWGTVCLLFFCPLIYPATGMWTFKPIFMQFNLACITACSIIVGLIASILSLLEEGEFIKLGFLWNLYLAMCIYSIQISRHYTNELVDCDIEKGEVANPVRQ